MYKPSLNRPSLRSAAMGAIALSVLLCGASASAADEFAPLLKDKKYAEAERAASSRLAREPNNPDALIAKSTALLEGTYGRIEEAVKLAETCVAAYPANARCHLALGNALGTKAMSASMLSAMTYIGTIRDSFKKAVELDPANLDARFSLLQFYMQAPGMAGGGKDKAAALATQTASVSADAGKLMTALIDLHAGNSAKAEAAALGVQATPGEVLAENQADILYNVAARYVKDKKWSDAERIVKVMQQRLPDEQLTMYGTGRLHQEQGKHREAVPAFEQALAKQPRPHIYYRLGQSLQALGDKPKAAAAYEKALAFKAGLVKDQRADAEVQLKSLKG